MSYCGCAPDKSLPKPRGKGALLFRGGQPRHTTNSAIHCASANLQNSPKAYNHRHNTFNLYLQDHTRSLVGCIALEHTTRTSFEVSSAEDEDSIPDRDRDVADACRRKLRGVRNPPPRRASRQVNHPEVLEHALHAQTTTAGMCRMRVVRRRHAAEEREAKVKRRRQSGVDTDQETKTAYRRSCCSLDATYGVGKQSWGSG